MLNKILLLIPAFVALTAGRPGAPSQRDQVPAMPNDPNTTPYCTWRFDNDGSLPCADMPDAWAISFATFRRWNPSITAQCGGFVTGKSYCVEAYGEPEPSPEPVSSTKTLAKTQTPTLTNSPTPSNGVSTPLPIQPHMVGNCNAFHFVVENENCVTIAAKYAISASQFIAWNPSVGVDSGGLWLSINVCVSIIGLPTTAVSPTRILSTLETATSTRPPNGVTTPSPAQPGMIANCNQFHFVGKSDTCASIVKRYGLDLGTFMQYNSQAGNDCKDLWLEAYACVRVAQPTGLPTPVNSPIGCAAYFTIIDGNIMSFVNTCPKTKV